jgi:predicted alpha/beta-hydrolase family hydrolase
MTQLDTGPADATVRLMLAHGAGAGMDSPFMQHMAELLADRGIAVTRFELAYMAARRDGGKRRPPPKAETLLGEYEAVVRAAAGRAAAGSSRLLIGGKSMGGRIASMLADRLHGEGLIAGLACLGYPFHPLGKPEQLRTAHLLAMRCPALIVQGERDPFGSRAEVAAMRLPPAIALTWIDDGDHDLGPRGASGFTRKGNMATAADAVAAFARAVGASADQRRAGR